MNKFIISIIFILFVSINTSSLEDKVASLPDLTDLTFNFYSGYLDLPNSVKSIHYFFEESRKSPQKDPVVLWLQGFPSPHLIIYHSINQKGVPDVQAWPVGPPN